MTIFEPFDLKLRQTSGDSAHIDADGRIYKCGQVTDLKLVACKDGVHINLICDDAPFFNESLKPELVVGKLHWMLFNGIHPAWEKQREAETGMKIMHDAKETA